MTSDPVARYLSRRGAKLDRKNRLRVMNSGEILDTALRVYQRMGLTFLRLTIIPALVCLASSAFVDTFVLPNVFTSSENSGANRMIGEFAGTLLLGVFVGGPLFLIGMSYSSAIVVQLVSSYMIGEAQDADSAVAQATQAIPKLFLLNLRELIVSLSGILVSAAIIGFGGYVNQKTDSSDITAGVLVFIGGAAMLAGIVLFLYFIAWDALSIPVAILEKCPAGQSVRRSRQLLKRAGYHPGGTGTIWSLYVLLAILLMVLQIGMGVSVELVSAHERIESVFGPTALTALSTKLLDLLPTFLTLWTLIPVWASVITIVYYERKIRIEGFDIDILASEIDHEKTPDPVR